MSAGPMLLAEATAAGVGLSLAGDGRVRFVGKPPPDLLARLRAHKAELVELLRPHTPLTEPAASSHPVRGGPVWHDIDEWRRLWREAATVPSRRRVLAAWSAAAGGELRDLAVCLPSGLPRRLALAEMTANAGYVGLKVGEVP